MWIGPVLRVSDAPEPPQRLHDLGRDRDCCLLRGPGSEVEPDRGVDPGEFLLGNARVPQPRKPVLVGSPGAHGPE